MTLPSRSGSRDVKGCRDLSIANHGEAADCDAAAAYGDPGGGAEATAGDGHRNDVPRFPVLGLTLVSTGATIVKVTAPLVPPGVVTVTFLAL